MTDSEAYQRFGDIHPMVINLVHGPGSMRELGEVVLDEEFDANAPSIISALLVEAEAILLPRLLPYNQGFWNDLLHWWMNREATSEEERWKAAIYSIIGDRGPLYLKGFFELFFRDSLAYKGWVPARPYAGLLAYPYAPEYP